MGAEVVVWEPDYIDITIPALECEARDCTLPRKADMIWHDARHQALHCFQVCGQHAFLLTGLGEAVFMPLGTCPPLERVAYELEKYVAARRAPVYRTANFSTNPTTGFMQFNFVFVQG